MRCEIVEHRIGLIHRWPAGRTALRWAGAVVALAGLVFFWQALT